MVDEVARYMERVESMDVLSRARPGEVLSRLASEPPERGVGESGVGAVWDSIFEDVERVIMPGLTHWQSPNFYAFFPANASGPSILGELLSAGLGVQGMLWLTSPACTELETRVLDWLGAALGLPACFLSSAVGPEGKPSGGGVIQGTASEAALVALCAARARVRKAGAGAEARCTVYGSTQAHSSIVKAAMIAGLAAGPDDRSRVRLIETDASHAMDPARLSVRLREDLAAGLVPTFVCASVGTTSSTAVDPVEEIARVLHLAGLTGRTWLHVDAAHAGAACVCPELRWMIRGVEHADSFCFNPHKWLLTNFDCDCFYTRDRASLTDALSITPEYLRNSATQEGVIDYRDWQVPLGRRFRALKLWFVLRHYGLDALRRYIREHIRLASLFESWLRADDRFEVVAPRTMNLICFRLRERSDERQAELVGRLNGTGRMFLTHTVLPGVGYTIRFCVGATTTSQRHVEAAWDLIRREAAGL